MEYVNKVKFLFINDDDYHSDVDTKAIVLPTLDNLVCGNKMVSTKYELDGEQIDVKDIRVMVDMWKKSVQSVTRCSWCRVVTRLVKFRQKFSKWQAHRVTEKEYSDDRQNNVARDRISCAKSCKFFNSFIAHNFY